MNDTKQQKNQPPEGVHITYQKQYRRCGKASCHCYDDAERRHGPYWYAYWRDIAGKLHSAYIGKTPPDQLPERFAESTQSLVPEEEVSDLDLELTLL